MTTAPVPLGSRRPRRPGPVGALLVLGVLATLPVAAVSSRGVPGPVVLSASLVGLALVHAAQLRLLRERLTALVPSSSADGVGWALAASALALALGDAPLHRLLGAAEPSVDAALLLLGTGAALVVTAAVTGLRCGWRADPRTALVGAGAAGLTLAPPLGLLQAAGLLRAPVVLSVAAGAPALVLLLVAAGLPVRAPEPAQGRGGVLMEGLTPAAASAVAVAALAVAAGGEAPGAVVVLAVTALVAVAVRVVLLFREVVALQGSRQAAVTDELTGLANRRGALARATALLAAAARSHRAVGLVLVDLERFTEVNEGLGHDAGDDLLRAVAGRLREHLGGAGLLARLGGDEFAVVVEDPRDPACADVVAQVGAALAAPFPLGPRTVHVRASTGVAVLDGGDGRDGGDGGAMELLRRADVAMHAAKAAGGGGAVHDGALDAAARGRLQAVEELRAALAADQLVLHHQPQLDVATGAVVGVEALVRWQHPVRGLLAPDAFLPLALEHGLVRALTARVLELAVAQAAAWRAHGRALHVAVNLSADDLQPSLVPQVAGLLHAAGLPASALVLEVTETSVVRDPAGAGAVLGELVELGVVVSVDDYGTGHSSLALLRHLPVGELKLDRSFTADLLTDARCAAIVRATVDLAHSLGLRLVAEGVEDAATLVRLRALGCDLSQGYLHSRPLPAAALEAWLDGAAAPSRTPS